MHSRLRHIWLCFSFLFFISNHSTAQLDGDVFFHLTTANGLSSDRVNCIIQDHEGFYWIATQDGLNCFDGSACKVFRTIKNDSNSISDNDCIFLIEDAQGDIWIATQVGLNRYKRKEGKFERFFFSNKKYSFEQVNGIRGLTKDDQGNIWVCSAGLWKYNIYSNTWASYSHDDGELYSFPNGFVSSLNYNKTTHGLWMAYDEGFIYFDLTTGKFYHRNNDPSRFSILTVSDGDGIFSMDNKDNIWFHTIPNKLYKYSLKENKLEEAVSLSYNGMSGLSSDNAGRIWLHYWIGNTVIYNTNTKKIDSSILNYFHPQSPLTLFTRGVFIDKENNYWIFSNKGISIYDPQIQAVRYYILNDQKVMSKQLNFAIDYITEQNDSILWIGSNNGLYRYNSATKKEKLIDKIKVRDNFIRCLYLQHDSVLWIGGHHELIRYDIRHDRILQIMNFIYATQMITEDSDNNIWVATWATGLFKFSADGKQYHQFLHNEDVVKSPVSNNFLWLSSTGDNLWLGYNGGAGFSQFNPATEIFTHFKITDSSFHANSINCMTKDKEGNLWLGTYGGGIVCYDLKKNEYKVYTQSDGLKGNFINGIVEDNHHHLWIETTNGLSVFDLHTHSIINAEIELGQESNDFFANGLFKKNNNVLFFSNNKIVEIDPNLFLQSGYPSKIMYSSFRIFDKEIPLSRTKNDQYDLQLSHGQNFFSFEYSLLKPDPEKHVQYAYQLKGFDKDWNYVGERRTAYYTNVPPGHYTFYVQATDATGNWSFSSEPIAITISPPFWLTWWFIAVVSIFILATLYYFYKYRIGQLKKVIAVRTKISQDLHDDVASTLSGIRLYSEIAKGQLQDKKAEEVMNSLNIISSNAFDMKKDMGDIVWTINPANDSLKKLLQKLNVYASDSAKAAQLQYASDIENDLQEEKLTMQQRRNIYLVCKEAINNAIKYSGAAKIELKVFRAERSVFFVVQDDGGGFDIKTITKGNGMVNMQMRAQEINAFFEIDSKKDNGTQVLLKVKL